jgi:uncharacterized protein YraI
MKKIILLICLISLSFLSTNTAEIAESKDKFVAAKSGLNLRSEPGKSSKVISTIPFGSKVTIEKSKGDEIFLDGRYGKWVNVKYDNKTGWVFSGFLCDFEPDEAIRFVADYYRNKFREKYGKNTEWCENQGIVEFSDGCVYIYNIIDNYIHLKIPVSCFDTRIQRHDVVWKYDVKQKKFFEFYYFTSVADSHFFYLDNDKYPDMVIQGRFDIDRYPNMDKLWFDHIGVFGIHIFLGTENGFKKVYDMKNDCNSYMDYYLTKGSCGNMKLVCGKKNANEKSDSETMYFFRYNCDKKKVEKYAESKIVRSTGFIASMDIKNMSVVIKKSRDPKGTTYKFSAKRFSTNADINYLNIIKDSNDEISFSYETIDGKKMILDIGWVPE